MTADLRRFGSTAVVQRFGFISGLVGVEIPEEAHAKIKSLIRPGTRSTLWGPADVKRTDDPIGHIAEWGITVNFEARSLLSDVPKTVNHPV